MIWDTLANIPVAQLIAFVLGGLALNFAPGQDVFFASACGIQGGPRAGALAGSALDMATAVRNAVRWLGVDLAEAERRFFAQARPTSLLRRFIEPSEVAALVAYVCSPRSAATNGAALRVEGGILSSIC